MYGLTFDSLDLHKWIKTRRKQITQVWILVLNNTDMECFGCHSSVCSTVECFGCDKSVCATLECFGCHSSVFYYGVLWLWQVCVFYQGGWTLWKGVGGAFVVRGINLVSENVISEVTPFPKSVDFISLCPFCLFLSPWLSRTFHLFFAPILFVVLRNSVISHGTKKLCDVKNCLLTPCFRVLINL